jgi:tRNA pseudouridine38-40 synthase
VRYFFEIAYNGKQYNGWQSQQKGLGVQAVVEDALSKLLRTKIETVCSGRTDTGVHCEQQYFHADVTSDNIQSAEFLIRINSFLPKDIVIKKVIPVKDFASARFDAIERRYRYEITRVKNPFLTEFAWHFFKQVDIKTMNEAAALLVGEQDFECFSKVKTNVNHFLCDIKSAEWKQEGDRLVFYISANRFLRGMVRAIVGTLLDVGTEKITMTEFRQIILSRDRKKAGANVPAHGLYLAGVSYLPEIFLTEE